MKKMTLLTVAAFASISCESNKVEDKVPVNPVPNKNSYVSEDLNCPKKLDVDPNQKQASILRSWDVEPIQGRYSFFLKSIGIYQGHPSKLAQLKLPDLVWQRGNADTEDFWIVCDYNDTSLTAMKKVPNHIHKCIFRVKHIHAELSVSCQ